MRGYLPNIRQSYVQSHTPKIIRDAKTRLTLQLHAWSLIVVLRHSLAAAQRAQSEMHHKQPAFSSFDKLQATLKTVYQHRSRYRRDRRAVQLKINRLS